MGSSGKTGDRNISLTDDGRRLDGPRPAGVPAGAARRAPAAHGPLGEEAVLQGAGLARGEQRGHQLPLPLHALGVGQRGGRSHRLHAGHRRYGAPGRPPHPPHGLLEHRVQI